MTGLSVPTAGWGCYNVEDGVHVAPMMDALDHALTPDCVCIPSAEFVGADDRGDRWLHVHHSLDGREGKE